MPKHYDSIASINKTTNRFSDPCEGKPEMYNNGELKEKLEIELAS